MERSLHLPRADGTIAVFTPANDPLIAPVKPAGGHHFNRVAYAAAHVVVDALADNDPWLDRNIDWERTIAFREYLWGLGLGVAEAMDTAQRGMGPDWAGAKELIAHAQSAARGRPDAVIAYGAGTDHLQPRPDVTIDDVIRAYEEQIAYVEGQGGRVILMASRALAAAAKSPDDYVRVYDRILGQVKEPVIIHWLGSMFDPALAGYWGSADDMQAMETATAIINQNAAKVDGVKISLLSAEKEIVMRRRLDPSVKMYTGDDFNYAELIAGDEQGYSHALLGIFDAIAPAASAALAKLARTISTPSTRSWRRPSRYRAISSRRRRASTRLASCSSPISTASRTISRCSAASRAPARSSIFRSCSVWRTRRAYCVIRISQSIA